MKKYQILGLATLFVAMILVRVFAHAANITPFLALALFSGFLVQRKSIGFLVPLGALFFSDLFLGLYPGWLFVYAPMALMGVLGAVIPRGAISVLLAAVGGSLGFFLISNLGVWWSAGLYGHSFAGLIDCYVLALPFLHKTLSSTVVTSALFYLLLSGLRKGFPGLLDTQSHG